MFAGDGGNVTIIVDEANTLLIDSRLDSRAAELTDATFKATWQPVTRLVNTHWHFDHTGGNAYFGSGGVTIIAQENVKNRGAERAFHWPARWALSNPGAINGDLFKQYDIEPGRSASDIGQLRSCAYGWGHNYLHRSGEYRRGRRHLFESLLPHYRSSVRRIHRRDDPISRSNSGAN